MVFENDKKQVIKLAVFGVELIYNIRYLTKLVTQLVIFSQSFALAARRRQNLHGSFIYL